MGIDVGPEEVLTSAPGCRGVRTGARQGGRERAHHRPRRALRQAAAEEGLRLADDGELGVEWVIAGLDREFDYAKLTCATRAILAGRAVCGDQRRRPAAG